MPENCAVTLKISIRTDLCISKLQFDTLGGDKVSVLTHTYSHKPVRQITVTVYNHQADSPLHV